jgi:Family of unknown function (DUF6518)
VLVVVVLVLSAIFGAADQYLGSLPGAHLWASQMPWMTDVSLLSAPWVLLPFLIGATQREPRRATVLGLACTMSALAGYAAMTLSPVEHAELTMRSIGGFVQSSDRVIVGGLVTGPLFGWLGYRWRNEGVWLGPVLVAGALCLEPLARVTAGHGQEIRVRTVWMLEVAVGLAFTAYVALATRRHVHGRA